MQQVPINYLGTSVYVILSHLHPYSNIYLADSLKVKRFLTILSSIKLIKTFFQLSPLILKRMNSEQINFVFSKFPCNNLCSFSKFKIICLPFLYYIFLIFWKCLPFLNFDWIHQCQSLPKNKSLYPTN